MEKLRLIAVVLLIGIVTGAMTACQSRPQLRQVAEDAAEKPINTPAAAALLKQQHEK
jgi:hypothetical protein